MRITQSPLRRDSWKVEPSSSAPTASGAGWSIRLVSADSVGRRVGTEEHDEQPGDDGGHGEGDEGRESLVLAVLIRRSLEDSLGSTTSSTSAGGWRSTIGADTGSVGRRRRRPGKAASRVPTAIRPPPIHNHTMSGLTNTRIVASVSPACGRPSSVR